MKKINYLINLSFFLYFVILLTERVISLSQTFINEIDIFSNPFYGYVYLLVFLSIISWLIYLVIKCRSNVLYLFKPKMDKEISFNHLIIASGLLLLSGMVHTEYTLSIIQFISYGVLILGILFRVIDIQKKTDNKLLLWLSFIYLVSFSMAIPVMYMSLIRLHTLFHIVEAVASTSLVMMFTYLLLLIFNGKNNLFKITPILLALLLDIPLIILRWKEEINMFVLIFISLSTILFIVGYLYQYLHNKKR